MSISRRLKRYLEENHVSYTCAVHPVAYTAQGVAAAQHVPGREIAKTVVIKGDGRYAMLVLPATMKVDLDAVRAELPFDRVELASERDLDRLFPDSELGAMPPFGNLYDLPVYVDRSLAADEIVFNAGSHVETVRMKYDDFERLVRPVPVDVSVPV